MKKFLVCMGAAILIVGVASFAFAQAAAAPKGPYIEPGRVTGGTTPTTGAPQMGPWQSWGHMEIQTVWQMKSDFNNASSGTGREALAYRLQDTGISASSLNADGTVKGNLQNRDQNWKQMAERFRFYLQYGDPKTVRAVIGFEADARSFGDVRDKAGVDGNAPSQFPDLSTSSGGTNHMGVLHTDQAQLEIKWAYLEFPIPNTPLLVSVGLQNFAAGGRLLHLNDAPGVKLTANFAPHKITAWWMREQDGWSTTEANNWNAYHVKDLYGLQYDITQPIWNAYVYGLWYNDLYTGSADRPADGYDAFSTAGTAHPFDDHPWWVGIGGGFRPGNWTFTGQFIYNGGTRDFKNTSDVDFRAWTGELLAQYQIGPGLSAAVEGFYATGNDANRTDKITSFNETNQSEARTVFGNDRTVFFFMNANDVTYYGTKNTDFSGMWYGRLNLKYSPVPWLLFNANYLYIGDNAKGTPGTTTDPITGLSVRKAINSPAGARVDKDESYVGSEINLITTFRITNNFVYNVGIAAFLPGSVYDEPGKDAETAYAIDSKLVYAF